MNKIYGNNIVACCKYCNSAKNDRTYEKFVTWIKQVAQQCEITL